MTKLAAGLKRMMGRRAARGTVALVVLLTLLVPATVSAVPMMGRSFYGDVLIGGVPAAEGTEITVSINGSSDFTWLPSTTVDAEGRYGWDPIFKVPGDDPETPEIEGAAPGDELTFFVGGNQAMLRDVATDDVSRTHVFDYGGIINLDLEVVSPYVVSTEPADGATDVLPGAEVSVTFSEPVTLVDATGVTVVGSLSGNLLVGDGVSPMGDSGLSIDHLPFDPAGETVTVTIPAGTVENLGGEANGEFSWSFTTGLQRVFFPLHMKAF